MSTSDEMKTGYTSFFERVLDVEENPRSDVLNLEYDENQALISIDIAIQKLSGIIPSILHDLSIAKERISKMPTDKLTKEESIAIYLYTMGSMSNDLSLYKCLNSALRTKDQNVLEPYFTFLKIFSMALSKLISVKQTVYRGSEADLSEKYFVGETFIWSEFSSCLTSVQMLSSESIFGVFGIRTFFIINCETGKDIQKYSSFSTETEILLLPGTKFKVISKISPSIDLHIIEIEEIERSNMLRQSFSPVPNKINDTPFIGMNPDIIDTKMMNIFNNLIKTIEKYRYNIKCDFSSMNINDEQIRFIANEIKTNTNWKILNLINNKIGCSGMGHLSAAIVLNTTLETLSLDNNYIADYGISLLTETLKKNFTLTKLTLSNIQMKENGAKSLALLLRSNSILIELSLDDNIIGDNGMIALCETLEQYNRTLKILYVNRNNISDKSIESIISFRNMNYVLNDFEYDGYRFSNQALDTLQTINKKHEEILKSLSYINNEMAIVYLEINSISEKRLSRDASFIFTNFRRLLNLEALESFTKIKMYNTIYLILYCTDDAIIRIISSFCLKKKIILYILGTINKNTNIFISEEPLIFRLTMHIANQYRSLGDQAIQKFDNEKARIYFDEGINIQQKLVNYLKKRQTNSVSNQNDT